MFCGNCGKQIDDGAAICTWCGASTGIKMKPAGRTAEERKPEMKEPMQKTGLGVSLCVIGAAVFWIGIASQLAAFCLIFYVMLKEKDIWVRAMALKAGVIIVLTAVLQGIFAVLQDIATSYSSFMIMVGNTMVSTSTLNQFCSLCSTLILIISNIVLLIAGFRALGYKNFRIGFLDRFVNQNIDKSVK